jgi:hypothetical protein
MAEPPHNPETGDDTDKRPHVGSITGTPRWVKVFGVIAFVVILVFVILLLTGRGGGHGPDRHTLTLGFEHSEHHR